MRWQDIAGPLTDAGLAILAGAIGGPAGAVAATVGRQVARELGVNTPQEVEQKLKYDPHSVQKLREFEVGSADQLALMAQEQNTMAQILARDAKKGGFWDAWRPATMWLIAFCWLWSLVLVHLLNGLTELRLPVPPMDTLLAFTGIYMALYMGGHTALRALGKQSG